MALKVALSIAIIFFALAISLALLLPVDTQAQFDGPIVPIGSGSTGCTGFDCEACHLVLLASNIIAFAVAFTAIVAVLALIYAGFLYITAGGDSGKIGQAHKVFKAVFIGFVIVLVAWLLVDTILKTLFHGSLLNRGFGVWNQIECVDAAQIREDRAKRIKAENEARARIRASAGGPLPTGYNDTRAAATKRAEEAAMRTLVENICAGDPTCVTEVQRPNACALNSFESNCTDVTSPHPGGPTVPRPIEIVRTTAAECEDTVGPCVITITGMAELTDHDTSAGCAPGAGTHCAVEKIDIKINPNIVAYVSDDDIFRNPTAAEAASGHCSRSKARVHKVTGSAWVPEGTHFDAALSC